MVQPGFVTLSEVCSTAIRKPALVEFMVIDLELSRFALVNAEGEDSTIAALCAPLNP